MINVPRSSAAARPVAPLRLPDDVQDLHLEIYALRDEVLGLQAQLAQSEVTIKKLKEGEALKFAMDPLAHVDHLETVVNDLEFQIGEIKASTTWKLGRFLLTPIRLLKR